MIQRKPTRTTRSCQVPRAAACGLACAMLLGTASAEILHYSIDWPSGLSLGEASLRSDRTGEGTASTPGWEFELNLDASVPGFAIRDQYQALHLRGLR